MNTQKRWAVSFISFGNNELTTEIVYADNWREAAMQHKNIAEWFTIDESSEEKDRLPDDQEDAKQAAFDMDCMLNVVEIPKD